MRTLALALLLDLSGSLSIPESPLEPVDKHADFDACSKSDRAEFEKTCAPNSDLPEWLR